MIAQGHHIAFGLHVLIIVYYIPFNQWSSSVQTPVVYLRACLWQADLELQVWFLPLLPLWLGFTATKNKLVSVFIFYNYILVVFLL